MRICPIVVIADTIQAFPTLSAKGLVLSGQIHDTECQNRQTWVRSLRSSRRSLAVQRTDSMGEKAAGLDSKKAWLPLHYSIESPFKTLAEGTVGAVCCVYVDCSSLNRKLQRPMGRLRVAILLVLRGSYLFSIRFCGNCPYDTVRSSITDPILPFPNLRFMILSAVWVIRFGLNTLFELDDDAAMTRV